MISALQVFIFISLVAFSVALPTVKNYDNAEETAGYFEGDMILTPAQKAALKQFNGLRSTLQRWDTKIIPYTISNQYNDEQKAYIRRALDTLELATCLKFVPRSNEISYVAVRPGSGCSSFVGKFVGPQPLSLAPNDIEQGCFRLSTIMHEFIHAIGFQHMQSTYDRDNYVYILPENIEDGTLSNFNKYSESSVNDFGVEYDYNSVMHYGEFAFSKNGKPTIVSKDPYAKIGQRVGLSRKDIVKINRMYECPMD